MTVSDPPVPVIAGAAQLANKDEDLILHPAVLAERAARAALADAGLTPAQIGGLAATPFSVFPTENPSELLAERLGLEPGLRRVSDYSGAAPQELLVHVCRAIAEGAIRAALIVGAVADASVRRARRRGVEPPAPPTSVWSQGSALVGEHRRQLAAQGRFREPYSAEVAAGAGLPPAYFALVDSVQSAGTDPAARRRQLGELMAPFADAAARRPDVAWFPRPRSPMEIATPGPANRLVAQPYTKLMCSFPTVDLAAAVVVADRALVTGPVLYPRGVAVAKEAGPPSTWQAMDRPAALWRAVAEATRLAGVAPEEIELFDLYSCFPAAVELASTALGLAPGDPRPRTVTGGLACFGGPGASYSLHGLVCMTEELRSRPEATGAVVGVGGRVTDFAAGIYSVAPGAVAVTELNAAPGAEVGGAPGNGVTLRPVASGPAVVDAMTVLHDREGEAVAAPVIARLPDGSRTGARAAEPAIAAGLAGRSLVGLPVELVSADGRVTYTPR